MATPLIITDTPPKNYPFYDELIKAVDVVMFLEEFCPYAKNAGPTQNPTCFNSSLVYEYGHERWLEKPPQNNSQCNERKKKPSQDVLYHHHLANRRTLDQPINVNVKKGDIVRLRIISSASMTNYRVTFGDLPATLVATDASWIIPISNLTHAWIAPGQRLDVVLMIPVEEKGDSGIYPIFAWEEGWRGGGRSGIILHTTHDPPPHDTYSIYARHDDVPGYMQDDEATSFDASLRAWTPMSDRPIDKLFVVNLTGSNGFDSINGRSYQLPPLGSIAPFQPNLHPLLVTYGDRVCIDVINHNADPHPFHLHGHMFTLTQLNHYPISHAAYRDTYFIPGGGCSHARLCFDADNMGMGTHPFHCHMQYHLAAGMLTTVEYVTHSRYSDLYTSHLSYPTLDSPSPHPPPDPTSLFSLPSLLITAIIIFAIILFLQLLWFMKRCQLASPYDPIETVTLSDREIGHGRNYQG